MRRLISLLSAVIATAAAVTALTISPAHAFGSETLGCIISPSQATTVTQSCTTTIQSSSYNITYQVNNLSGNDTFAWSVPAGYPITLGCTSTAIDCAISAPDTFQRIKVSVVITQGSSSETLTSRALIPGP